MTIEERIRQVDALLGTAEVSVAKLADHELRLAEDLCEHFDLPFGTLLRRGAAVRLAGGQYTMADCLREAAQHLIAK